MKKVLLASVGALSLTSKTVLAAAPDPTSIITSANTAFEAVGVVLIAVALFFTILYYARKAKGR